MVLNMLGAGPTILLDARFHTIGHSMLFCLMRRDPNKTQQHKR